MTTRSDIATRFAERVKNPTLRERNTRRSNVIAAGDRIYSYGRHFIMAEVLRNPDGSPRLVLVNGDRYSSSTTGHQSMVRSALAKHAGDVPTVIIPFRALDAAGIIHESIVPLEVFPERHVYTRQVSAELPTTAERRNPVDVSYGPRSTDSGFHRLHAQFTAQQGDTPDPDNVAWQAYIDAAEPVWAVQTEGEWQGIKREGDNYVWQTRRHWLGDALFAARTRGSSRRVRFLSSFDRQESTPLYFLCQLPPCRAETVDDALEALKPDAVKLAEAVGRQPVRQGDIFAVPMPGLTAADLRQQGATFGKRTAAMQGIRAVERADRIAATLLTDDDVATYRDPARPWGTLRRPWDYLRAVREHRIGKWQPILRQRVEAATAAAEPIIPRVSLLGTSHVGTEVATLPDGTQYARGVMYHDPRLLGENRDRDHRRQKMGDGTVWHLIVKNTVPVQ